LHPTRVFVQIDCLCEDSLCCSFHIFDFIKIMMPPKNLQDKFDGLSKIQNITYFEFIRHKTCIFLELN